MKSIQTSSLLIISIFFLPVFFFLTGCAAKKPLAESPETGLTLLYKSVNGNPGAIDRS